MIPIHLYTPLFYHGLFVVVVITCLYYWNRHEGYDPDSWNRWLALPLFLSVVLYLGLRPISGAFGDMGTYAVGFRQIQSTGATYIIGEKEWIFQAYMHICGLVMNANSWFLLTAILYIGCLALALYKIHKNYTFTALLFCVASLSFWSYGTNGIRNGLATSIVILGFSCFHNKRKWVGLIFMATLFFLASNIHKSTLLPILCFVLTILYNRPLGYLLGWCVAVVLSILMGGFWENFFANLNLVEDMRLHDYLLGEVSTDVFNRVGFRWDFLLYSLAPIGLGWYYIHKRGFNDSFYLRLFNTYVAANAAWVLVCRAAYSNRFAYLSWFLMFWVIVYPLISERMFRRQWSKTATILLVYYVFTYFMCAIK